MLSSPVGPVTRRVVVQPSSTLATATAKLVQIARGKPKTIWRDEQNSSFPSDGSQKGVVEECPTSAASFSIIHNEFRSAAVEEPLGGGKASGGLNELDRSFKLLELTANGDWEGAAAKMNELRSSRGKGHGSTSQARKKLALLNQQEANLRAQLAQVAAQKKALVETIEQEEQRLALNKSN
jgi:hypothetical protein